MTSVNIFPLSARMALEGKIEHDDDKLEGSNLPLFTAALEKFLLVEKGFAVIKAACGKGINAAHELRLGLELEMKALDIPISELRAKSVLFDEMVKALQQEHNDNSYIFKGEMKKVYRALEQEIARFQETYKDTLEQEIEQIYQSKGLSGRQLIEFLEKYIEDKIKEALTRWQPTVERKVKDTFDQVVSRFMTRTNNVVGELLRQSAEIFDLRLEGFTKMEVFTDETRLYYIFGEEQTLLLPDSIRFYSLFLPKFISGPMIMTKMRRKIEQELDRNCGRLRTDYNERVAKSAHAFQGLFEKKFDTAIEGTRLVLTRTIEKREQSRQGAVKTYEVLSQQLTLLESAITGLIQVRDYS